MTIQLGRLEWAAQLAGIPFPDADEDALWRCARAWHSAADQLRLLPPAAAEIGTQVAEAVAGETAARFEEVWRPIGTDDGPLARLADACDAIAAGCDRAAAEIEQAKLLIRAELTVLVSTMAVLAALPGVGLVGGLVIAPAVGAARLAILIVLERLVRVIGGPIAALLDLRGVVDHVRALLGVLAGSDGLGSLSGDPSTGAGPGGGAGGRYVTQPSSLFGLQPDLPGAFDHARALLLASLPSLNGAGPQGTAPPSTPDTHGRPVLSAGSPALHPTGSNPPPPVPPALVPAPPIPSAPVPVLPPMVPVPPPVAPVPPPGAPTPQPNPPPPAPVTPSAPRPPVPSAPAAVPAPPPTVTPPAGPPAPASVVAPIPGPPAGPGAPLPGVSPVAVVVGLPGAVLSPTWGGAGRAGVADAGTAAAPEPVPLTAGEALARARACLFATDAGYGFYPPGDENRDLARAVRPAPGQVILDLFGDAEGFTIDNGRLTPAQFAGVLRELIGTGEVTVRPEERLRLHSGCTAQSAATLADESGIEVVVPTSLLWTYLDGEEVVANERLVEGVPVPNNPPDGQWCGVGGYEPRTPRNTSVS